LAPWAKRLIGIPIGAGLLYPFVALVVSPELAAAFMAISSVSVTLNTLLLKRFVPSTHRGSGGRGTQQPQPRLEQAAAMRGSK
jgi:Cu+-exporting ATPase